MRPVPQAPSPAPPPAPSLLPREHGAWGQLAMPLVTGLALGRPGPAPLLLAAGVVLAFLAHEPLLVVVGQRGRRVRDALGERALRRLALLGSAAAVAGIAGLALAPPAARLAALAPAVLAVAVVPLVLARLEKTTAGELVVAAALSAAAAPVAIAGGAPAAWAWGSCATWLASFGAAMLPVRATLLSARTKGARELRPHAAAGAAAIGAAGIAAGAAGALPWPAALGILPTAVAAAAVALLRVRPQRFTQVGWSLVAASTATLLALVLGFRLG
jgi:hypothetical protein